MAKQTVSEEQFTISNSARVITRLNSALPSCIRQRVSLFNAANKLMATDIYLVRHGETEWNVEGRFQGRKDSPLTAVGRTQAESIGRRLSVIFGSAQPPRVHVSPLGRTRATADIIGAASRLPKASVDERLRELSLGEWDGLRWPEIEARWPERLAGADHYERYFRSPGGETLESAQDRARSWLEEVSGPVVAISHGQFGRILRGVYARLDEKRMLALPVPQDIIWHLHDGKIEAIQA